MHTWRVAQLLLVRSGSDKAAWQRRLNDQQVQESDDVLVKRSGVQEAGALLATMRLNMQATDQSRADAFQVRLLVDKTGETAELG